MLSNNDKKEIDKEIILLGVKYFCVWGRGYNLVVLLEYNLMVLLEVVKSILFYLIIYLTTMECVQNNIFFNCVFSFFRTYRTDFAPYYPILTSVLVQPPQTNTWPMRLCQTIMLHRNLCSLKTDSYNNNKISMLKIDYSCMKEANVSRMMNVVHLFDAKKTA